MMKKFFKITAASFFLANISIKPVEFRTLGRRPAIFRASQVSGQREGDENAVRAKLERMTVKQLRSIATAQKIKGRSKARRKADLIALLAKAES